MKRKHECSHGGKEQYSLPPNAAKEGPSDQGSGCNHSVRKTTGDPRAEGEDGPQNSCPSNLTTRQRQGKLFEELDLSRLNSCLPELAEEACQLLAKYHNIFSLEPVELGCTHSTKHMIRVTDDTPFKE